MKGEWEQTDLLRETSALANEAREQIEYPT